MGLAHRPGRLRRWAIDIDERLAATAAFSAGDRVALVRLLTGRGKRRLKTGTLVEPCRVFGVYPGWRVHLDRPTLGGTLTVRVAASSLRRLETTP